MWNRWYKFWNPSFHLCYLFKITIFTCSMLAIILDPCYEGLRLVYNKLVRKKKLQIVGEDNKHVLFPLLICAYKVMNLNYVGEKVLNSTPQIFMTSCRVMRRWHYPWSKNSNHYKTKNAANEECKDLLTWWKVHDIYSSYVRLVT